MTTFLDGLPPPGGLMQAVTDHIRRLRPERSSEWVDRMVVADENIARRLRNEVAPGRRLDLGESSE